jgi:hypothetical protein
VDCDGAGDADGLGEPAGMLDVSAEPDEDVLAAGDWTLTGTAPLEQPAASAASKQPPSRTLLRLPTTDPRSIHEVDIPATQAQHNALCRGGNGGPDTGPAAPDQLICFPNIPFMTGGTGGTAGQAGTPVYFILDGLPAFYRAADPVPVVAANWMRTTSGRQLDCTLA